MNGITPIDLWILKFLGGFWLNAMGLVCIGSSVVTSWAMLDQLKRYRPRLLQGRAMQARAWIGRIGLGLFMAIGINEAGTILFWEGDLYPSRVVLWLAIALTQIAALRDGS